MTNRTRFLRNTWPLILQRTSDVFRGARFSHGDALLALADTIGDLLVLIEENRPLATLSDRAKKDLVLEVLQAAAISKDTLKHADKLFDILFWTANRCQMARERNRGCEWWPSCLGGSQRKKKQDFLQDKE